MPPSNHHKGFLQLDAAMANTQEGPPNPKPRTGEPFRGLGFREFWGLNDQHWNPLLRGPSRLQACTMENIPREPNKP